MISRDPFPEELRGERDPSAAHFSDSLPEQWFEQVTNERRRRAIEATGRPLSLN
jgi:hypothetical protein